MAQRGWNGTPIDAIAVGAGVAPQTIYAAFGNKRALLPGMRQIMLRDSRIPELMAAASAEPDPRRRLELWAELVRRQMETSYDIISIHRQAAAADPLVAADYREVLDNRYRTFTEFVRGFENALPAAISAQDATDLLWCFSNEELYRELVSERKWSPSRFQQWLARTLIAQILEPPGTG